MRMKYLSKLTYREVWLPPSKQLKTHQNIILLDWDDTLLPTSFFLNFDPNAQNLKGLAKEHKTLLVSL